MKGLHRRTKDEERCKQLEQQQAQALRELNDRVRKEYANIFAEIPSVHRSKSTERHRITFTDPGTTVNNGGRPCPPKYHKVSRRMEKVVGRVRGGRQVATVVRAVCLALVRYFEKDPKADPRWICDFRAVKRTTVKDRTPWSPARARRSPFPCCISQGPGCN